MKNTKAITKWLLGAAVAGAFVLAAPHKAQAQVGFGVEIGPPVPAYGYYAAERADNWQRRQYFEHERWEAAQRREHWEHERWERERWDRDRWHDRDRRYDRDDRHYDRY